MRHFLLLPLLVVSLAAGRLTGAEAVIPSKADIDALFAQHRYEEAVAAFRLYLQKNPDDLPGTYAFASLLSQMRQHPEAAQVLEALLKKHPEHLAASFKLGAQYAALQRTNEAERIFQALTQSSNKDLAAAAADALRRLRQNAARAATFQAEQQIHQLAAQAQQREVLKAIAELEKAGPLSWTMEMQRLYAWQSLGEFGKALQRAEELARRRPKDADLGLLRGELLVQAGRRPEALALWRQVEQENPGSPAAGKASQRIAEETREQAEEQVYELARRNEHRQVIAAVAELEKEGADLPLILDLQRLYALQALQEFADGLARAEKLAAKHPESTDLALLRADFLFGSGKTNEATQAWRRIVEAHPGTPAAVEAAKRLQSGPTAPTPPPPAGAPPADDKAEARIYELSEKEEHREVVLAIDELEKRQPLSWNLQMQRLYALSSLGQGKRALELADKMAQQNPRAPDLALVRADLLAQQGQKEQATALWREIATNSPDTPAAVEAERRLREEAVVSSQQRVYDLARRNQHEEVLIALAEMEKKGPLPLEMEMQRLYSLQALGRNKEAAELAATLCAAHPNSTELALLRADCLMSARDWRQAAEVLKELQRDHPATPVALEAENRLALIPAVANVDKWNWGEAYLSGDYYSRWESIIGSGFVRSGTYIPGARRLQPFVQFQFVADTQSGTVGQPTVIADNFVGFYGGVRLQVLPTEYLFLYAMAGTENDLLDSGLGGDWAFDYQAGIYGFKAWGPGMILYNAPLAEIAASAEASVSGMTNEAAKADIAFWRGDWFVDVDANFSYYKRYSDWIGYGQTRQGFRLFQLGRHAAFDGYAVENLTWDVRGNFYDNFVSLGPGVRLIWVPHPNWEVVLRAEYLNGFYFGRDAENNQGSTPDHYDEAHVGLSVGMRW